MTSTVTRNTGSTIKYAVITVVLAGLSFLCFSAMSGRSGFLWVLCLVGGIGLAVFALGSLLAAKDLAGTATCPRCQAALAEIELNHTDEPAFCDKCQAAYLVDKRVLTVLADDYVHPTPVFSAPVTGQTISWPEGCCLCARPATRGVEAKTHDGQTGTNVAVAAAGLALGGIAVRTGGGTTYTLRIPHCAEHDDGAKVEIQSGNDPPLQIRFRSYAYQRRFLALNPKPAKAA
ncbi:hypothetical protein BE20_42570 [Sorangium cellulosum]|uniref:Uncharacterized protein n=1 Tax=Sorangium cellulosum TaxID=56 RepID=A0A150SVB9_SORCE|nr:hypothetical protein BE20_42570 [Sorangium cellulosum]KYF98650.1 hypothetical protein BE18_53030 [Sorangium cellulosum]